MNIFFTRIIDGDIAVLEGEEASHLVQVLRRKTGDSVRFTDGLGNWYDGVLAQLGKKNALVQITEKKQTGARRPYTVHVAIAPTKNMDRLEWFCEKATEIGVDRITPIWCTHSERKTLRADRLEKILVSAMKQSLQCFLPILEPAQSLKNFVDGLTNTQTGRFIGYVDAVGASPHLFQACEAGKDALVLIGPEGDFSPQEVNLCVQHGFQTVSLGANRLRTETAGLAAVHILALKNEVL